MRIFREVQVIQILQDDIYLKIIFVIDLNDITYR